MSEAKPYEVTIIVADKDGEVRDHYEAPLSHATVQDVAADLKGTLNTRSGHKVREINPAR